METRWRSWAKSVSWRIIGVVVLGGISYGMTRDWEQTTVITAVFHLVRFVMYYYHERAWERIPRGKPKHPLACFQVREELTDEEYQEIKEFLGSRKLLSPPEYEI